MRDNINTPAVIVHLLDLVSATNTYMRDGSNLKKSTLLQRVSTFVKKILNTLGLYQNQNNTSSDNKQLFAILTEFTSFRNDIRASARKKESFSAFFKHTDNIRLKLLDLGVALTDDEEVNFSPSIDFFLCWVVFCSFSNFLSFYILKSGTGQAFKLQAVKQTTEPKGTEQIKDNQEKTKNQNSQDPKKLQSQLLLAEKELKKLTDSKTPPKELFQDKSLYSEWDSEGIPTKKADSSEIPKTQLKTLNKKFDSQKKFYEDYQKKLAADPDIEKKLTEKVQDLQKRIKDLSQN